MKTMNAQELKSRAQQRVVDHNELQNAGLIAQSGQFFPAGIHYPPITMVPPSTPEDFLRGYKPLNQDEFVLYVHIPYCARRCTFCHYPVVTGKGQSEMETYVDLLGAEMDLWLQHLGIDRFRARSVLIAGGTPTYFEPKLFRRFHEVFEKRVDMDHCSQVTYDVHPEDLLGTAGAERIAMMKSFGSDRLTLGLQSLDNDVLKKMNRGHTEQEAYQAIDAMRKGGIDDICIEFIFGYPNVSTDLWIETLEKGIATDVQEIQLYRLKIPAYGDSPGPVQNLFQKHPEHFPAPEEAILQKQIGILLLEQHGFYENLTRVFTREPTHISHYAADQCCQQLDCIGIGQSAFSSLHDRFAINNPDIGQWAAAVKAGNIPLNRGIIRNRDDDLRWHIVLPLKNSMVNKTTFHNRTGERAEEVFRNELDALASYGLVAEDENVIQLTPKGRFFADEICAQFHHPKWLPFSSENYNKGPLFLSKELLPEGVSEGKRLVNATPACPMRADERAWPWTAGM